MDGTLCDTFEVDEACFRTTAAELLSIPLRPLNWEECPHVTDSGIVGWLWRLHRCAAPDSGTVGAFVDRFAAALTRELQAAPHRFLPVPGADTFLRLLERSGWNVAIATGGWARTAELKLRAAGLPADLLRASSDDSHDRLAVFELAYRRALVADEAPPGRVVLVGDGVWDMRVASQLGWSFLGVGRGEAAVRLRRGGANAVIGDFSDGETALRLMSHCSPPRALESD